MGLDTEGGLVCQMVHVRPRRRQYPMTSQSGWGSEPLGCLGKSFQERLQTSIRHHILSRAKRKSLAGVEWRREMGHVWETTVLCEVIGAYQVHLAAILKSSLRQVCLAQTMVGTWGRTMGLGRDCKSRGWLIRKPPIHKMLQKPCLLSHRHSTCGKSHPWPMWQITVKPKNTKNIVWLYLQAMTPLRQLCFLMQISRYVCKLSKI